MMHGQKNIKFYLYLYREVGFICVGYRDCEVCDCVQDFRWIPLVT